MKGWISLHRKIQEHWLYEEERVFSKFEAWVDILLMVNHEPKKIMFDGELIDVQKGQRITSIRKLGERWNWSRTKVTAFLTMLEKDGMIQTKKDTKKTLLTVVNYGFYQGSEGQEMTPKSHSNDSEVTQKSTNNNENNDNNENKKEPAASKLKFEAIHMELAEYLLGKIRENHPELKEPNLKQWAVTFRLMIERDNREPEKIRRCIDWVSAHDFWHKNILSADKLRKQYDKLAIQAKETPLNVIKGGKQHETNQPHYQSDYSKYNFRKRNM